MISHTKKILFFECPQALSQTFCIISLYPWIRILWIYLNIKPVKNNACMSYNLVPEKIHTDLILFISLYYTKHVQLLCKCKWRLILFLEVFAVLKIHQETGQRQSDQPGSHTGFLKIKSEHNLYCIQIKLWKTCMHLYAYKIRCTNIALEKLVLLPDSTWRSFKRTNTILSQKSLTQDEIESKRNILAYTPATSLI